MNLFFGAKICTYTVFTEDRHFILYNLLSSGVKHVYTSRVTHFFPLLCLYFFSGDEASYTYVHVTMLLFFYVSLNPNKVP